MNDDGDDDKEEERKSAAKNEAKASNAKSFCGLLCCAQ